MGGGQKMVSSTEWTSLCRASFSLWCSRLPSSPYPPCICPLIPDVSEAWTPPQWAAVWAPPPNLMAMTFPTGHAVLTALPPQAGQSLCGAPTGSTLLLWAWLWSTPICSQLYGQPQPAPSGKGLLSPRSGHPGLSTSKALSIPFTRGQAHAGSSRRGAGASNPERASNVDPYCSLQMQPFI